MARILYGVSGDGFGHATRSKEVIDNLLKKHEVVIVAGDKAYDYLSQYYVDIHRIFALRIMYGNNKVRNLHTAIYNIKNYPKGRKESMEKIYKIAVEFKPELIITDFEYFTDLISKQLKIPAICIDNNHILSRCNVDIPKSEINNYLTTKLVVDSFVRNAKYYLITTFFYPKKKNDNTFLFPPIMRKKVLKIRPKTEDFIFVYQTSETYKALIPTLNELDENFVVYGLNKNKTEKNVTFRKFNDDQFYKDIGNCKGIITNGGFTLISEALFLHKPILTVPIRKQFEQICNAIYIKKLGYGEYHKRLTKNSIEEFVKNIPSYKGKLRRFKKQDNQKIFKKIR